MNNKMHFKMYKSGKNWMVAGLMTTAVLAGLTLSNVNGNEVVAHADSTATTQVVAANSSATSAQISAASENVTAKSTALSDANSALSDAQSNYNSVANSSNSGVAIVASDSANVDATSAAWYQANKAANDAAYNRNVASNAYSDAVQSAANAGVTSSAVAYQNSMAANYSEAAASDTAKMNSAQQARSEASAAVSSINDQITTQNGRINNTLAKLHDEGVTDAEIESGNVPAEYQGDYNIYKELWAGMDSLNGSLSEAQHKLTAAATDYGTYRSAANKDARIAKVHTDNAAASQKVLDAVAKAKSDFETAQSKMEAANTEAQNAETAYKNAVKKLRADRDAYGVPTHDQVTKAQGAMDQAKRDVENATAYNEYNAASEAAASDQAKIDSATAKQSSASSALSSAQARLSSANAAVNSASAAHDDVALSTAKKDQAEAQQAVDDAQGDVENLASTISAAKQDLANAQQDMKDQLAANDGQLQKRLDKYNAAKSKYDTLKSEFDSNADPTKAMAAAQAALDSAKANQAAAQKDYDEAVAEYNKLTGETPVTPSNPTYNIQLVDHITAPETGHVQVPDISVNTNTVKAAAFMALAAEPASSTSKTVDGVTEAWKDQAAVDAQRDAIVKTGKAGSFNADVVLTFPDGHTETRTVRVDVPAYEPQNAQNQDQKKTAGNGQVANNFTGEKNGSYYINGSQVTAAQYQAYVAQHSSAAASSAATSAVTMTRAEYRASQNSEQNAEALPQTGDNNSMAMVALGAATAMFGFGLAAKKREY